MAGLFGEIIMKQFEFLQAVPVWEKGKEKEKNYTLVFKAEVKKRENLKLFIACSSIYQVFAGSKFVAAGPARAAHSIYKVDEIDLSGINAEDILIYVSGYNTNLFCITNEPSFLCAELTDGNKVLAATGIKGFSARVFSEKRQKVQRYSYQRAYSEYYIMDHTANTDFDCELVKSDNKKFVCRDVHYPEYKRIPIEKSINSGRIFNRDVPLVYNDRSITKVCMSGDGFLRDELEFEATKFVGELSFKTENEKAEICKHTILQAGKFATFELDFNNTGFIDMTIEVKTETRLIITFDEMLDDNGDINYVRNLTANVIVYDLKSGIYHLTSIEPYTFRYIRITSFSGDVDISDFRLIEYKFPEINVECISQDERDIKIFNAAVETFRQSTLDIYMDCPSRERAGWLCDSFFMARAEYALTGKSVVERSFLENFLSYNTIKNIPSKMLPMLYPADFRNESFIPNWAMFYVIQLEDYFKRSNDNELIVLAKDKIYGLLDYFKDFENEFGLLEKLENWVFVEWSKSNDYVQDVNFPTNMLYYRMKLAAATLYDDKKILDKAERLKKTIIDMSYKNGFFCDRAIREENGLIVTDEMTETAQYYAFFTGVATIEAFADLWEKLKKEFGPERDKEAYTEISQSNAFIGNYLRLELLRVNNETEQLIEETRKYFLYMAEKTGTLWEHTTSNASLCHGFASYVVLWYLKNESN